MVRRGGPMYGATTATSTEMKRMAHPPILSLAYPERHRLPTGAFVAAARGVWWASHAALLPHLEVNHRGERYRQGSIVVSNVEAEDSPVPSAGGLDAIYSFRSC
jgi:hypothetical protein